MGFRYTCTCPDLDLLKRVVLMEDVKSWYLSFDAGKKEVIFEGFQIHWNFFFDSPQLDRGKTLPKG